MIYLDHAATSLPKSAAVVQAVAEAMQHMGNPARGSHPAAMEAARTVFRARELMAALVHAEGPDCVAFTMNASYALNFAIQGLLSAGDELIVTEAEHNSVLRPAYLMQERGVGLTIVPCTPEGLWDNTALEAAMQCASERSLGGQPAHFSAQLSPRRVVLATSLVSNVTGRIAALEQLAELCRKYEVLWVADGAQAVGAVPLDMQRLGIAVLCFTGHKALGGPQGTGGLIVRRGLRLNNILAGGSGVHSFETAMPPELPGRLEPGTLNVAGLAGLAAAAEALMAEGIDARLDREQRLRCRFLDRLCALRQELSERFGIPDYIKLYGLSAEEVASCGPSSAAAQEDSAASRNNMAAFRGSAAAQEDTTAPQKHVPAFQRAAESLQESTGRLCDIELSAEDMRYVGIVSLNLGAEDAALIADELAERFGIACRAGAHCAPLIHRRLGTQAQGILRFSFSAEQAEADLQACADALRVLALEYLS